MYIRMTELFKVGIGPSSSHTMGPLLAASRFLQQVREYLKNNQDQRPNVLRIKCSLKGSLAFTGRGHASDHAITLGLHGYTFGDLREIDIGELNQLLSTIKRVAINDQQDIQFSPDRDIEFDQAVTLSEHPNGMIFFLVSSDNTVLLTETYFSIGGGFINTIAEMSGEIQNQENDHIQYPFPFEQASDLLKMAADHNKRISAIKLENEIQHYSREEVNQQLDHIWVSMKNCLERGLKAQGILSGGLNIQRRARQLKASLLLQASDKKSGSSSLVNEWLCAYAMAVNEENAAGHMVVTAPTNGAAGVIPAVLYYFVEHEGGSIEDVREFLLTAGAIGSIIKHNSSISGAEVGCQGEVGSASAMAAAGLCAVKGGSAEQIENAAEIALEHHLGMTCDPVKGLVQVPCIERNGFGAIKAYTAASLSLHGTGQHFMSLDNCIKAMYETGQEMSIKFKETSLGGLAVNFIEC